MTVTLANDATHNQIGFLPKGLAVGYTTGTPDIKWTAQDWTNHPGAVRIVQDNGTDITADLIDCERGAASNAQVAAWAVKAQAAYRDGVRPGQRWPGCYTSLSNVTPLANELVAVKVTNFPLVIARWDDNEAADATDIALANGPFPTVGFQYNNAGQYDQDVFSTSWLNNVSVKPGGKVYAITHLPPGEYKGMVTLSGYVTDGIRPQHTTSNDGISWSHPRLS